MNLSSQTIFNNKITNGENTYSECNKNISDNKNNTVNSSISDVCNNTSLKKCKGKKRLYLYLKEQG